MNIRLNKYLVEAGICSRREADRLIESGQIRVNNRLAVLGEKVNGDENIEVRGKIVSKPRNERVYIAYNKPVGIICTSDPKAKDNIINAIHYPERIFHIGRLDVASSGLILLTNDGAIVNAILRAEEGHEKEYEVFLDKPVTDDFLQKMSTGVMIDGRKTLPTKTKKVGVRTFSITLIEGRNRQIRKMCEALDYKVEALQRVRIMHIQLGSLPTGQWRHLTKEEEQGLR